MPPRFRSAEVEIGDTNVNGQRAAPIQVGRMNLRVVLARDAGEGVATIGLCRIVERRADNKLVLDTGYIPPTLDCGGNELLAARMRDLHGMLHQRGEALAARLAQPGRAGIGEIADFLMLQLINRNEPLLAQLRQASVLHPREFYYFVAGLVGELATFREGRRPGSLPAYAHDSPAVCFEPMMDEVRQSLSTVMEQTAISIALQDRKFGVRVATIPDIELQRTAQFVMAVSAQIPGDALRARFPTQVKIGTVERIRDLVNLQLPGVPLRPLPVRAATDPVSRRIHLFRARNARQRHVEAVGELRRPGDACGGRFPGA